MATPTFSTGLSRRTMLAGGAAAAILPPTALPSATLPAAAVPQAANADGDHHIALLAGHYRQAIDALTDWIDMAERRDGPFAYNEPEYSARYHQLIALEERCAEARARPAGIRGLVFKLRPAFHCDSLYRAKLDCDERVLLPALHDLERLVEDTARAGP